ncbi:hypothetical protein NPIL_334281 [Nephila pilipes]|uniref:Uncharacterized protein n=1 Tax=Nephila pilipes TaxID=299642 RepID=A0A8X6MW91_NEPPI|nr:hypothetical protein NPIL_334281 [Nephila pilipes]
MRCFWRKVGFFRSSHDCGSKIEENSSGERKRTRKWQQVRRNDVLYPSAPEQWRQHTAEHAFHQVTFPFGDGKRNGRLSALCLDSCSATIAHKQERKERQNCDSAHSFQHSSPNERSGRRVSLTVHCGWRGSFCAQVTGQFTGADGSFKNCILNIADSLF